MTTANSLSQASIEQIDLIFTGITSSARTIQTLSYEILNTIGDNQKAAALCDALGHVASSVGYMAEEGLGKLGAPRNSAEHWFLPPLLQIANEQQSTGGAHHD